jgi:hypothetical protein
MGFTSQSIRRNLSYAISLGMACCLLASVGCTRRFYRNASDRDVEQVLTEKNCFDPWRVEQWHVYPDPMARFADPTNPDRPPMPEDDPAARMMAPNPQVVPKKAGQYTIEGTGYLELLKQWDAVNRAAAAADPPPPVVTVTNLPEAPPSNNTDEQALKTDEHAHLINLDQSSELGLINSREFQDRREDLYSAALAVTLQRFNFAAQFFATGEIIREYTGRERPEGQGNRWRFNDTVGFTKLFATGALLSVQLANQIIVEMSGPGRRVLTPSVINLDLVQPLLQGGGRAVTLEPLTQVERTLVYATRAYARFRKQFYVSIAAGGSLNPSFPGGGFGDPRLPQAGQAPIIGYLPTLLRSAILDNDRANVRELERILAFYRQLQGGGDVSPLQTDQVLQQLLTSRSTVLQDEIQLRNFLDQFKLQLGLPTSVPLELDDSPIRSIDRHLARLRQIFAEDAAVQQEEARLFLVDPARIRAEIKRLLTELPIVRGTPLRERVLADLAELERLPLDQLEDRNRRLRDEQERLTDQRNDLETRRQPVPPDLEERITALDYPIDLGLLEERLRRYEAQPWRALAPGLQQAARADALRIVFGLFVRVVGVARDERLARVRETWPQLPPACVNGVDLLAASFDEAVVVVQQVALTNRLDLMNARAQLVDQWRQIAVNANALLGVANIAYHMDSTTRPEEAQPFAFNAHRTRHQLILNGELPLVRRLERNNYRTALIAWQRQRRSLQAAEDQVLLEVRNQLRQLRVQSENYKIQQRAIQVAYSQRDNSIETLRAPSQPGQTTAAAASSAAALTQQLLNAQSRVPQNENQLYAVYVNYQIARLQLFRDLELMPLDNRGVWTDEHTSECAGPCVPAPGPDAIGAGDGRQPQPERLPEPRPAPPGQTPPE